MQDTGADSGADLVGQEATPHCEDGAAVHVVRRRVTSQSVADGLLAQRDRIADARIGVEDRGFQFADGVYEVIRLYGGKAFTLDPHLDRLTQSAKGIELSVM